MVDGFDQRRKKLLYRSHYTGTKETDLLFGQFAQSHIAGFDETQLDAYEALLEIPDPRLYKWATGQEPAPDPYDTDVLAMIQRFRPTF